ncbi:MAG: hypothetical protein Q8K82_10205 [Gemmatimonadaceae bacterium]|nr:hypothetical protein [Gemmatimonadaceae bacterium]
MVLDVRSVGRKTPVDGKLEITAETARRLESLGTPLPVQLGDATGAVALLEMSCSCAKGWAGGEGVAGHTHHFLESALFKTLVADRTVVIELVDGPSIRVSVPFTV